MTPTKTNVWKKGFVCLAVTALIFSACKKSNDNSSVNGIAATVQGSAWQSKATTGYYAWSFITIDGYMFNGDDSTVFEVAVSDTATIGNTDVDFSGSSVTYYDVKKGKTYTADGFSGHGAFKLTAWDKTKLTVAGTFSGVLYSVPDNSDSITVTNGRFNSSYVAEP